MKIKHGVKTGDAVEKKPSSGTERQKGLGGKLQNLGNQ